MDLPKDANGQYYYSIGGVYYRMPAGIQGEIMANKLKTAQAIVTAVQAVILPTDTGADLVKEYFDVGQFVDGDVAALGITASDLGACITLLQQVGLLMTGQATTPADYTATLNKVRRV